jgi:anti-anti-sigma factor
MQNSSAVIVRLPETFGAKEARKLKRELKDKITPASPNLIADLSRVKKIDLKGMEALLGCLEEVALRDGALQIGGVSPQAATLLELTRLDQLFAKFPAFDVEAPAFELKPEVVAAEQEQDAVVEYSVAA